MWRAQASGFVWITKEGGDNLADELTKCLLGTATKKVVFSCVLLWSVQKGHDTEVQSVQNGHDASGST